MVPRIVVIILALLAFVAGVQFAHCEGQTTIVAIKGLKYYATNENVSEGPIDFYYSVRCFEKRTKVTGKSEVPFGVAYILRVPCISGPNPDNQLLLLPPKGKFTANFTGKDMPWGYRIVLGVRNGAVVAKLRDIDAENQCKK